MTDESIRLNIDANTNNGKNVCAYCDVLINKSSDSGWEVFLEGGKTQSICIWCHAKPSVELPKAVEESEEE